MTQFTTEESGLFSAGEYNEQTRVLTVTFRPTGASYDVPNISAEDGREFMTTSGKSALWQRIKHNGPVRK